MQLWTDYYYFKQVKGKRESNLTNVGRNPGMVVHAYNPSTQDADVEGSGTSWSSPVSEQIGGQPSLHESVSNNHNKYI